MQTSWPGDLAEQTSWPPACVKDASLFLVAMPGAPNVASCWVRDGEMDGLGGSLMLNACFSGCSREFSRLFFLLFEILFRTRMAFPQYVRMPNSISDDQKKC